MALQVIGAGFGRTGTNSLKEALETLGYGTCHHMHEVIKSDQQIDYWYRISNGETLDWDMVFEGFNSSVDWPSARYYKELAEHFPDAKVVLSVRDAEKWHLSVMETIYPLSHAVPWILRVIRPAFRKWIPMVETIIWQGVFEGRTADREFAIAKFNANIEEVKRTIPAERLLIHEAKDGWESLCAFLGKPVPDTPYPRTNDTAEMKGRIRMMRVLAVAPWVVLAVVAGIVVYFLVRYASLAFTR